MSILLHIESSTDVCSVAVSDGMNLLSLVEDSGNMRHSEILTSMVSDALLQARVRLDEVKAISLSEGPGSYTSLRVGAATVKALCYAKDIPLITINTLYSIAHAVYVNNPHEAYIMPMIDARRMEVYASLYDKDLNPVFENQPVILTDFDLYNYINIDSHLILAGNGAPKAVEEMKRYNLYLSDHICSATNLISIAFEMYSAKKFSDVAYFSPNYIKPPNITVSKNNVL